jgi:type IV pilus assembly protein PilM
MGLRIMKHKSLPIGVDLGSSTLKMAQLRTCEHGLELLAAGSAKIPYEIRGHSRRRLHFLSGKIRSLLRSGGFQGRQAILSMPAPAIFLRPVKIPISLTNQMEQAIRGELRDKLPYPVEQAVIRHILAGTVYVNGKEMQERIVAVISEHDLRDYMKMARGAGLDLIGANIEACAIVECFSRLFRRASDDTRTTLFIDIGSASTQVVLTCGQQLVFARNLPVGGHTQDQAVAEALQIPIEQAHRIGAKLLASQEHSEAEDELFRLLDAKIREIAEEITHCLRYCESSFRSHAIDRVIFVGGQAHNRRLCQSIAERLNLPAQVGDPMAGVRLARTAIKPVGLDPRKPQPSWAVAIGLSLGAATAA